MIGAGGIEQQRLVERTATGKPTIEQQLADPFGARRAAWLAREHDLDAAPAQVFAEAARLG